MPKTWVEKNKNLTEVMTVIKPVRIPGEDGIAKTYKKGDTVKLSGSTKKLLYHQGQIAYPEDVKEEKTKGK